MKSEREKMLAGELYYAGDPELSEWRKRCRLLFQAFNASTEDPVLRRSLLMSLFECSEENVPWIEPPFYCDYGSNISLGKGVFFNFGCVVLDVCAVSIGEGCLFAPGVQIYTATHPVDWELRAAGQEFGSPVSIGAHVWVGGGAIICPGVTIGDRSVIGAGSVVTRDIPADVVAVGNPCQVVRSVG